MGCSCSVKEILYSVCGHTESKRSYCWKASWKVSKAAAVKLLPSCGAVRQVSQTRHGLCGACRHQYPPLDVNRYVDNYLAFKRNDALEAQHQSSSSSSSSSSHSSSSSSSSCRCCSSPTPAPTPAPTPTPAPAAESIEILRVYNAIAPTAAPVPAIRSASAPPSPVSRRAEAGRRATVDCKITTPPRRINAVFRPCVQHATATAPVAGCVGCYRGFFREFGVAPATMLPGYTGVRTPPPCFTSAAQMCYCRDPTRQDCVTCEERQRQSPLVDTHEWI